MIVKNLEEVIDIIHACEFVDSETLESEEVEFKLFGNIQALHNSKELAEEVSALANKNGGVIIVGIKDGSNVIGRKWETQLVGFEKGDVLEIQERIKGKITPKIDITAIYKVVKDKNYLIIHIPNIKDTLVNTTSGKSCIRDGRSSRPMTPAEIRIAVNNLNNYDWTADILEDLDTSYLDENSLISAYYDYCERKEYTEENKPRIEDFLEAIGVTTNGQLTKAGLLFLGKQKEIEKHLGTYEYRFSWKNRSTKLILNEVWDLNLWDTIKKAKEYFSRCNTNEELNFKNKKYSVNILNEDAFHEAFMNAIVHRDYSLEGMVVVDFDSVNMKITNPGTFYGGVTSKNISIHQPRHRNKFLAKLLMNYSLVDRAGMGVKRMGIGSLSYGRELPTFEEVYDTVEVSMPANAIIPPIFVLTQRSSDEYSLVDLIILNSLYRVGYKSIPDIARYIKLSTNKPWYEIRETVKRHVHFELCGTKDGVFIRINPSWNKFFDVVKPIKISTTSEKHVKVFDHLLEFNESTNEDITSLLEQTTAHTSKFLRTALYTNRTGNGRSAVWKLNENWKINENN